LYLVGNSSRGPADGGWSVFATVSLSECCQPVSCYGGVGAGCDILTGGGDNHRSLKQVDSLLLRINVARSVYV